MTLSDTINRMIQTALENLEITSASPTFTNTVKQINRLETPDLEAEIKDLVVNEKTITTKKKQKDVNETVESYRLGNVNKIQGFSTQQFGNLQAFVRNPFLFVTGRILRGIGKGAGLIFLFTLAIAAAKFVLDELFKPGRPLATQFKRQIKKEILLFNNEREQAELRQGFRSVIITTMKFLRGDQVRGQISGNLYNPTAIPLSRLDPRRMIAPNPRSQGLSGNSKFFNRRMSRFG